MYALYCLLLWVFVYTLPALAVFPRLIITPYTAFAIPVLSVFIIYCLSSILIAKGLLTSSLSVFIAGALALVAGYRVRNVLRKIPFSWKKQDFLIYGFHLILLLPYFVKLGTHAFERGDEIYSWNFWAIQHYFLEPIDFSHTGAPYPQLFPKLLAFCYHLVGSLELQLPVRATLIIFPWAMLVAIAIQCRNRWPQHFLTYLLVLTFVLAGVGLEQFFDDAYADPIMTSCLIVSAVLFWQSQQSSLFTSPSTLTPFFCALGSVLCAITAAHTKQPGLLWAIGSLPLLLWMYRFRLLSALSTMGGLCWLVGEGRQFHHNKGVIWLSLADRDPWSQLLYAVDKYFISQPLLLALFLSALIVSRKDKVLFRMMLFFVLPSLLCWFFFGAYHLRLGQHLIAFAFFVVIASGFVLPEKWLLSMSWSNLRTKWSATQVFLLGTIISIGISCGVFIKAMWFEKPGISLYAGGRQSLQRYFGTDSDYIYDKVYTHPEVLLWVPSRYLYGLFYKHAQLTTPAYLQYSSYDQAALINELQQKLPDYVFTVSQDIIDGPASKLLSQVISACPAAFEQQTFSQNRFGFVTYKVNKQLIKQDPCLQAFSKDNVTGVVAFGR